MFNRKWKLREIALNQFQFFVIAKQKKYNNEKKENNSIGNNGIWTNGNPYRTSRKKDKHLAEKDKRNVGGKLDRKSQKHGKLILNAFLSTTKKSFFFNPLQKEKEDYPFNCK